MNSKICSVIVPIYNAAPFLAQCLSSIRMQTYQDLQVILVNDGSTDESAEIAKSFVEADKRFILIQQSNKGQSVARNIAMEKATGEYIVFVDADDYIDSDFIDQHTKALGDADYVQSGYRRVTMNEEVIEQKLPLHRYQFVSPCMRLYRRDYLQSHHLQFPEGMIYEDVVFSLRIWATKPHVQCIDYIGYNYTYNHHSTSTTSNRSAQQTLFRTIAPLDFPLWLKCLTMLRLKFHFRFGNLSQHPLSTRNLASVHEPLISIIIPVYNATPYLVQCLSSIKMQTYRNLQIILVDDGSTDESAVLIQNYIDIDKRFTMIQQPNQGQSVARNIAMEKATGEYIVFVDADDYIDSDFIEQHLTALGDADYVQSGYRRVSLDKEILEQRLPIFRHQFTSAWARLYRRDYLQSHHLQFPEGMIYEDVVFSILLWDTRPHVRMIKYVGYNYTFNPTSTTATHNIIAQQYLFQRLRSLRVSWWIKQLTILRLKIHFL